MVSKEAGYLEGWEPSQIPLFLLDAVSVLLLQPAPVVGAIAFLARMYALEQGSDSLCHSTHLSFSISNSALTRASLKSARAFLSFGSWRVASVAPGSAPR